MTALPSSVSFTDSGITEAQFKTAIANQREFLAGLLGTDGEKSTALQTLGSLGNDTVTKSANYTIAATDRGLVFLCSGTFTLSLTAAATLADGFAFAVINTGSGIVTIDPNSTEQIDGASTKDIAAGSWAIVSCTGTAFYSMGAVPTTGALIGYQVFTASGTYTKATNNPSFVIVEVVGGGGGQTGGGGTSSFGSHCSATGGSVQTTASLSGANGGVGSSGDINLTGQRGLLLTLNNPWGPDTARAIALGGVSNIVGKGTGSSYGVELPDAGQTLMLCGGGGGGYSSKKIASTSLVSSETVTIGAAGAGAGTVAATAGIVIVWEYK